LKTFKLVSLKISHPQDQVLSQDIDLIDGLVINKEDQDRQWLVEIYIDKVHSKLFTKLRENEQEVKIDAIITRKDNDPASFITTVRSLSVMEDNMSVLFNGLLVGKTDISEGVLTELIEEGYHGNDLLEEFKKRVSDQKIPKITAK
jgi:predicted DNA binding protein